MEILDNCFNDTKVETVTIDVDVTWQRYQEVENLCEEMAPVFILLLVLLPRNLGHNFPMLSCCPATLA